MWPFKRNGKQKGTGNSPTRDVVFPKDSFVLLTAWPDGKEEDGGEPVIVSVNEAYAAFEHKDVFQWVLIVSIFVRQEEGGGLPTGEEAKALDHMEDHMTALMNPPGINVNALSILRETDRDLRRVFYAVYDPEPANKALQGMIDDGRFDLPWSFTMTADSEWKAMQLYFDSCIKG